MKLLTNLRSISAEVASYQAMSKKEAPCLQVKHSTHDLQGLGPHNTDTSCGKCGQPLSFQGGERKKPKYQAPFWKEMIKSG